MKKFYLIMLLAYCMQHASAQSANQSLSNLTSPTAVNVDLLPLTNNSVNLGSSSLRWKSLITGSDITVHGLTIGVGRGNVSTNTALGNSSLLSNTTGSYNTASGFRALYSNTTGSYNTASGSFALYLNTTGNSNTGSGMDALYRNTTGISNTASGSFALESNTTGSYNTANGYYALSFNTTGYNNTASGTQALYSNTTGYNNTASGYYALSSNTVGSYNTANGDSALFKNHSSYNTASGFGALYSNNNGIYNTASGFEALYSNTSGENNTAAGTTALYSDTSGYDNTASGFSALLSNTSGYDNTASGMQSLYFNTIGTFNTASGLGALKSNTSGNGNTAFGYYANVNAGNYSDVTLLGSQAAGTASNQVRIGSNTVTSIGGYTNWTNISDGRVKKNIKENVPGLAFINKLKPITYNLDLDAADKIVQMPQMKDKEGKPIQPSQEELTARKDKEQIVYTGFVAQDVAKAAKALNYDFSGVDAAKNDKDLYGLRYSDFVVPLVKAVQELSAKNDSLQDQINELKAMIVSNQSTINNQSAVVLNDASSLQQNIPNPFTHNTTIGYTLPQKFTSAQIVITNKMGNTLKAINILGSGKGNVNVDASTLAAGAYQYSLIIDGRSIATKQMVLAR